MPRKRRKRSLNSCVGNFTGSWLLYCSLAQVSHKSYRGGGVLRGGPNAIVSCICVSAQCSAAVWVFLKNIFTFKTYTWDDYTDKITYSCTRVHTDTHRGIINYFMCTVLELTQIHNYSREWQYNNSPNPVCYLQFSSSSFSSYFSSSSTVLQVFLMRQWIITVISTY